MKKSFTAMLLLLVVVFSLTPNVSFAAVAKNDANLIAYLEQVSSIRGFEITVEDYEDYLIEYYDIDLAGLTDYTELQQYQGEVIKSDYSNIQTIYADYGLNQTSLIQLLEDNGDTIDNYIYVEDLDMAVFFYSEGNPFEEMFLELGLTDEELEVLDNHFTSIESKLSNPEVTQRLDELSEEMMNFPEFESVDELSDEQVAQFLSIFNEMLEIFELEPKFYLTKGNDVNPISLNELILLKDPDGYHLLIELYNLNGDLLLDVVLTPDMIGSGIIEEIGEDVKDVPDAVEKNNDSPATEKGGKLPNTATNHIGNSLIGMAIAAAGYTLFRRLRKLA